MLISIVWIFIGFYTLERKVMRKIFVILFCVLLTSCAADVEMQKNEARRDCLKQTNEEIIKACLKSIDN